MKTKSRYTEYTDSCVVQAWVANSRKSYSETPSLNQFTMESKRELCKIRLTLLHMMLVLAVTLFPIIYVQLRSGLSMPEQAESTMACNMT